MSCWEWTGYRLPSGYGVNAGRYLHRIAYEHRYGPIPPGLYVCHHCDNPSCFNPAHLFVGTARENMRDASRKGRLPRGERNTASKLTAVQVVAMRQRYQDGGITQEALGREYGVEIGTTNRILRGSLWAHVGGPRAPHQKGWRTPDQRKARRAETARLRRQKAG